jgi:hypothetical protein
MAMEEKKIKLRGGKITLTLKDDWAGIEIHEGDNLYIHLKTSMFSRRSNMVISNADKANQIRNCDWIILHPKQ